MIQYIELVKKILRDWKEKPLELKKKEIKDKN